MLGDVLARFDDESVVAEIVLRLGGLVLLARLCEQALARGQSLGAYAADVVRRYADSASDEEWMTLIGLLTSAEDPGALYLKRALTSSYPGPTEAQDK
jgi:hypothetical protein